MDIKDWEFFGKKGLDYWYFIGKKDLIGRELSRLKQADKPKILVVGCGVGDDIGIIESYGDVTALDCDLQALEQVPSRVKKVLARIEDTGFVEEFDLIVMLGVLEHIDDDFLAIQKVKLSLKNGGRAIICVPACGLLFGPHDLALSHRRRYSAHGLRKLLENAGFNIISFSYWNSILSPLILAHRVIHNILHMGEPAIGLVKLPNMVNNLLIWVIRAENRIRDIISFPFGIEILAIVEKRSATPKDTPK
ncbi:MAG: methyltransferase domain-containing protein [Candidatus Altiarchaeota archaeon]